MGSFSPSNHWFNRACSLAVQARERAYRLYQDSPSASTHSDFISARNRCKATIRRVKHSFIQRKCDNLTLSPSNSAFWSLAKNVSNNFCNSSFPPLIRSDDSITISPSDKANLFGSLFSSNSSLDDSNAPEPLNLPLSHPIPPFIISHQKVLKALLSLETNKAQGPDGIPAKFLKEFAYELSPVVYRLFCLIVSPKNYPTSWEHPLAQPVP